MLLNIPFNITEQKVQKYVETESETEDVGEKSTPSSPRKRMNSSSQVKTESKPAANGFAPVVFAPVRRDLEGLAPMEQRKCPIQDCDSSGNYCCHTMNIFGSKSGH